MKVVPRVLDDDHRQLLSSWFEDYHAELFRFVLRLTGRCGNSHSIVAHRADQSL